MCSIAGFVSKTSQKEILDLMNRELSHRGSDDSGLFVERFKDDFVHLAHNRLSILDISQNAHQPFVSDCKRFVIVYNGEVYNFRDIKEELVKLGYFFRSKSDTEVILYAYKEWGVKCIEKFIGMFAFCIYDKKEGTLFLARDRAGVKPLYFYDGGGEFVFASEIKAFHKNPSFIKELNEDVLPFYMRFGYVPSKNSIFKNLYKLEQGCYMLYDIASNKYEIKRYWSAIEEYKKEKFQKSEEEIERELEEILYEAAAFRMIADVDVGIFLSGGYDSSFIAAILQRNYDTKLNTFSIGFEEKEFDESSYAENIAKYLGTKHQNHFIKKKELVDIALNLPFIYDEPFADDSTIPTVALSSFARNGVKVVLSGDGGDEVFCGYSKYSALYPLANSLKKNALKLLVGLLPDLSVEGINSLLPQNLKNRNITDKYDKFKRAVNSENLSQMFINASSNISQKELNDILFVSKFIPSSFKYFDDIKDLNFLDQMMAIDYITYLSDNSLVKVDRASMSFSLEAREPLIDHRIVEYLSKIPVSIKYKNKNKKYLLKKILHKYIPKEKLQRPKSGFQPPLERWLRRELSFLVDIYLDETRIKKSKYFIANEVLGMKKAFKEGKKININKLWSIIVFEMWRERWMG